MHILPLMPIHNGYEPSTPELNQEEGILDISHESGCILIEESKIIAETLILRCAICPIRLESKSIHV
ncbi:MAG TPA: hypothetical protein VMW10_12410, partial [Alphaproteobacteria bacterium]|nr:hypothetical protein [Alphaproteobacteria bacterium]